MTKKNVKTGGLGRSHREGITLADLTRMFPDSEAARRWFESNMWPDGPMCPRCGNRNVTSTNHHAMPYYCAGRGACHRRFSVKTNTVMDSSNITLQNWAIATYQFATNLKGISSMKLHRDLGITQKSAWFMVQRLRESWKALAGADKMEGPVEIDEAYIGGREKNRHADKKGTKSKVAVVGIKDRKTRTIRAKPVPETTAARLGHFVRDNAEAGVKRYGRSPNKKVFYPRRAQTSSAVRRV